jgi:hypothetical protein
MNGSRPLSPNMLIGSTPSRSKAHAAAQYGLLQRGRLHRTGGEKVPFRRFLLRCGRIYLYGLGLGIPIVVLITLIRSHSTAAAGGLLSWDESSDTRVVRVRFGEWRTAATALFYLSVVAALEVGGSWMDSPDNTLKFAALVASRGLPTMIDDQTRLDSVEALPGRVLQYNFSIIDNDTAQAKHARDDEFYGNLRTQIKATLCSDADSKPLRDFGAIFRYLYHDKSGKPLRQVEVTSQDCAS